MTSVRPLSTDTLRSEHLPRTFARFKNDCVVFGTEWVNVLHDDDDDFTNSEYL
jgi:hypothetical protein